MCVLTSEKTFVLMMLNLSHDPFRPPLLAPAVEHRGDGFQTVGVTLGGREDPNPFFKSLFSKPYLNQVVISPHVYGKMEFTSKL